MSRHSARERALGTLFQMDLNDIPVEEASAYTHMVHEESDHSAAYDEEYYQRLVDQVRGHRQELDALIDRLSKDWEVVRMPGVDRNILRIGLFEMIHVDDVPAAVAINEAIELAKKYASDASGKFINGVLAGALKLLPELQSGRFTLNV